MSNPASTSDVTASVQAPEAAPGSSHLSVMDVSGSMVVLTWITFIVMSLVLYKIAWKPILTVLDEREKRIKKSLDDAEQMRKETELAEARNRELIATAAREAKGLLENARQAAAETAAEIERKAREESRALLIGAQRSIEQERLKAVDALRKETANLAITLAGRVIRRNLNDADNRALTQEWMKEIGR